jgi:hypothetical protein
MLRCGGALAGILHGDADARAVLFSPGSRRRVARLLSRGPASAYYNKLVTDAVANIVKAAGDAAPIRIVEIGGGTGGCTAPLLASLPPERVAYTFTDITPFFVAAAEREFGSRSGFKAATLDLEKDLGDQGFTPPCADILIAANVLHATADVAQSLAGARTAGARWRARAAGDHAQAGVVKRDLRSHRWLVEIYRQAAAS